MDQPNDVTFYLEPSLLKSAREGEHNFISLMSDVMFDAGLDVHYHENTGVARLMAETRPGYAVYHMDTPNHDRAVTIRRAYFYPFWRIEISAKRWEWDVALTDFEPHLVDRTEAERFYKYWQHRLYGELPKSAVRGDYIYVPLQGLIRQQRNFQACSPIEMLARTAARYAGKRIIVTLHPKEDYTSADRLALAQIIGRYPHVEVLELRMDIALRDCDFVVTMNSSAAFSAVLFGKPAVIFGQIDFHHITGSVMAVGEDEAFATVHDPHDFEGYFWWFLQVMAINGGRADATDQIRAQLRGYGWPV